ncbi:unnamed protein product [Gordionus sp. m RMFG-2023]
MKFLTYFIACLIILGYDYFSVSPLFYNAATLSVKKICHLPKVVGPCRAAIKSWYYNPKKRKCLGFTYGGCKGNLNNFGSIKSCQKFCARKLKL